jgi:hypothetical protein
METDHEPVPAETDAHADERRLLLVPHRPGPLLPLDAQPGKHGDDLDVLIDEVFGPPTDEGPGAFDAALVVVGLALLAWSVLGAAGAGVAVVGVVLLVLGVALPARAVLRAGRARRVAQRERAALASGLALDVSDPSLNTLVASYEWLRTAAGLPGVPGDQGWQALEAAHAALLEVASLLDGRPPQTEDEHAYVDRRTAAIRDLTAELSKRYRGWRRRRQVRSTPMDQTAAVVRARNDLEAATGTGAVTELERLRVSFAAEDRSDDA